MVAAKTITKKQARLFLLKYQGLYPPRRLTGKDGILEFIRRAGCIQFDPLNKVGRNPDLVLQSRIKDYKPEFLEDLLYRERRLLDGWDKNMSIYSREDWPYFSRCRERARKKLGSSDRPATEIMPRVREDLREQGPLSSIDLKYDQVVDWSWAPTRMARAALESMYSWGELIIHHKVGTRKVYDFACRHLPSDLLSTPDPNLTEEGYLKWRILRRVGGIGLVHGRTSSNSTWLGISELNSQKLKKTVNNLLADNLLQEVRVEGIGELFYLPQDQEPLLKAIRTGREGEYPQGEEKAALIAPLDNLLWDRELINELFEFEYVWEVYKPVAERKYGYYVLPLLYGDRFIARIEPELDKKTGELNIKNWWWEPGFEGLNREQLDQALNECLQEFMYYLGAEKLNTNGLDRIKL